MLPYGQTKLPRLQQRKLCINMLGNGFLSSSSLPPSSLSGKTNCLLITTTTSVGKHFGLKTCDISLLQGFPNKTDSPRKTQKLSLNLKSIIIPSKVSLTYLNHVFLNFYFISTQILSNTYQPSNILSVFFRVSFRQSFIVTLTQLPFYGDMISVFVSLY